MKTAKRYGVGFALLGVLCICVFGGSAALSARLNNAPAARTQDTEVYTAEENIDIYDDACEFLLMEYNGKICVYTAEERTSPIMITDIDAASLRSADREMFKNGVGAADREELLALLEDFGS